MWFSCLEHSPINQKVGGFDSQLEQVPKLQVQSPVRALMGGNQSMFLSHRYFSLSPFLSLSRIYIYILDIHKYIHLFLKNSNYQKLGEERMGTYYLMGTEYLMPLNYIL